MNNITDYTQDLFANRIGGMTFGLKEEIFKFEKIKRAKRAAKNKNPHIELIDLGVGEPDEMADPSVLTNIVRRSCKTRKPLLCR